jgi:hypothetical protein
MPVSFMTDFYEDEPLVLRKVGRPDRGKRAQVKAGRKAARAHRR